MQNNISHSKMKRASATAADDNTATVRVVPGNGRWASASYERRLIHHPWISISQLPHPEGSLCSIATAAGVPCGCVLQSTNASIAARELVLLGAGIGLLPDYAVKRELKAGRLVQVLAGWQFKKGIIAAVFPHRNYLAAKTRTLVEFLKSEFREYEL